MLKHKMKISGFSTIFMVVACGLIGCNTSVQEYSSPEGSIMTVLGPIPPDSLGKTLIHEHVFLDWSPAEEEDAWQWNNAEALQFILPYVEEMKSQGVQSFVECTPKYIGRNPRLLKKLSEITGLNVLTNTGFYAARNFQHIPDFAYDASPHSLAAIWIKEFEEGIEGTGIRPGFIKIGLDYKDKTMLTEIDEKIVRAAALTHQSTGLTIVAHSGTEAMALACLEVLKSEGVAANAFVWTHAQNSLPGEHEHIASHGAWVSIDGMGSIRVDSDSGDTLQLNRYVDYLVNLKQAGMLDRTLISHDAGWYTVGEENTEMSRPYTAIFKYVIPALKEKGFTAEDVDQMLVKNARTAYTIHKRLINR
ncbi:MAG: phosphotriesterase [Cyclobacteriaceae bacterium]